MWYAVYLTQERFIFAAVWYRRFDENFSACYWFTLPVRHSHVQLDNGTWAYTRPYDGGETLCETLESIPLWQCWLPEMVNLSKYVIRIFRNNDVVKEPYLASGKFWSKGAKQMFMLLTGTTDQVLKMSEGTYNCNKTWQLELYVEMLVLAVSHNLCVRLDSIPTERRVDDGHRCITWRE